MNLTVGEALLAFRNQNRIDSTFISSSTWSCQLGPLTVRLPNFVWRREAILRHDLHHILTGYPCTMRGEFQMATWEFAAGPFPHPAARLFCLPLVAAGIVWSPRSIWLAYISGRRSRSLYGTEVTKEFLQFPLHKLCADASSGPRQTTSLTDLLTFGWLMVEASLTVLMPVVATILLALALCAATTTSPNVV